MSNRPRVAVEIVHCATHRTHAAGMFPVSASIELRQLEAWLTDSRRVFVTWDVLTGIRQERQAATPLGADKAQLFAQALWQRYCHPTLLTWAEMAERQAVPVATLARRTTAGLLHLRYAFRPPFATTPPQLQPGTLLAVALYGCDWQPLTDAAGVSVEHQAAGTHTPGADLRTVGG